jgi:hypothetical protein
LRKPESLKHGWILHDAGFPVHDWVTAKCPKTEGKERKKLNWPKISPDFGSPSRHAKGCVPYVFCLWRNAEGGPEDKQDWSSNFVTVPRYTVLLCVSALLEND